MPVRLGNGLATGRRVNTAVVVVCLFLLALPMLLRRGGDYSFLDESPITAVHAHHDSSMYLFAAAHLVDGPGEEPWTRPPVSAHRERKEKVFAKVLARGRKARKKFAMPSPGRPCEKNRTLLLLHAGGGMVNFDVKGSRAFLQHCPELCVVWEHTTLYKYAKQADVVQYHGPGSIAGAHRLQLSMYFTMESPRHSALGSPHGMRQFNLKRSYHLDSDIFAAYIPIGEKHLAEVTGPPPVSFRDRLPEAMATIVSNCAAPSNRLALLGQLQKAMDVHSFGACMHNKNLPASQVTKGGPLTIVQKYKFYLAVENSLCRDYVTEKLWRALYHGAIPVVTSYDNTPNYTLFTPNAHAYINVEQFPSVAQLVKYLKRVAGDESLFRHHLQHRYSGKQSGAVSEEYRRTWGVHADRRRFCRLAHRMLVSPGLEALSKRRVKPDTSCAPHGHFRAPPGVRKPP